MISDEIVATSVGVTVRRVMYEDPETGMIYAYLTNLPTAIPPGIVAQRITQRTVKFIRWLKNHLDIKRTWAQALASLAKIYATS